jgi:hypothetical protein
MDEEGQEQAAIDFNVEDKMKMLVESYTSLLVGDMKPSSIEETPNSTAISELNIDETENHPKRVVPTLDDTPTRKKIRQEIYDAKVKQAKKVNSAIHRKLNGIKKDPLEVNDICTLLLPPNIKSVMRHVPVMVTEVVTERCARTRSVSLAHTYQLSWFSLFMLYITGVMCSSLLCLLLV